MPLEGVREFRRRLAEYLRYVRTRQEPVFITRRGRVIAALIPARGDDMEAVEAFCRERRRRASALTREEALRRLEVVLPELRARYGVRRLILFGSLARGEPDPDSDVDVVVDMDGSLLDLVAVRDRLEEVLGRPVDVATPPSVRHLREVERDGVVVGADVEVPTP